MSLVIDALRLHAATTPNRIAVDDGSEQLTFAKLLEAAELLATRLLRAFAERNRTARRQRSGMGSDRPRRDDRGDSDRSAAAVRFEVAARARHADRRH